MENVNLDDFRDINLKTDWTKEILDEARQEFEKRGMTVTQFKFDFLEDSYSVDYVPIEDQEVSDDEDTINKLNKTWYEKLEKEHEHLQSDEEVRKTLEASEL